MRLLINIMDRTTTSSLVGLPHLTIKTRSPLHRQAGLRLNLAWLASLVGLRHHLLAMHHTVSSQTTTPIHPAMVTAANKDMAISIPIPTTVDKAAILIEEIPTVEDNVEEIRIVEITAGVENVSRRCAAVACNKESSISQQTCFL